MLFALVSLVVVVPLLVAGFREVVLPVTIAVLFISGPVSAISFIGANGDASQWRSGALKRWR